MYMSDSLGGFLCVAGKIFLTRRQEVVNFAGKYKLHRQRWLGTLSVLRQ